MLTMTTERGWRLTVVDPFEQDSFLVKFEGYQQVGILPYRIDQGRFAGFAPFDMSAADHVRLQHLCSNREQQAAMRAHHLIALLAIIILLGFWAVGLKDPGVQLGIMGLMVGLAFAAGHLTRRS